MAIFIPFVGYSPGPGPVASDPLVEIDVLRDQTHWFIRQDPTAISLIPRSRIRTATGGYRTVDLPPRPQQIFKLIHVGDSFATPIESGDGVQRQHEFVLHGEWNSVFDIGDWWADPNGQRWEIGSIVPDNGYQRKAGVYSYGKYPGNG